MELEHLERQILLFAHLQRAFSKIIIFPSSFQTYKFIMEQRQVDLSSTMKADRLFSKWTSLLCLHLYLKLLLYNQKSSKSVWQPKVWTTRVQSLHLRSMTPKLCKIAKTFSTLLKIRSFSKTLKICRKSKTYKLKSQRLKRESSIKTTVKMEIRPTHLSRWRVTFLVTLILKMAKTTALKFRQIPLLQKVSKFSSKSS